MTIWHIASVTLFSQLLVILLEQYKYWEALLTQLLNWINLSNTLWFKNNRKKIKYSLKREGAFYRLREDTTPGNSNNRTWCSNRWVIRGILLQSILDNWTIFQELRDGILEGKVNSEIRGQVIGVQTQMQSCNFFFGI